MSSFSAHRYLQEQDELPSSRGELFIPGEDKSKFLLDANTFIKPTVAEVIANRKPPMTQPNSSGGTAYSNVPPIAEQEIGNFVWDVHPSTSGMSFGGGREVKGGLGQAALGKESTPTATALVNSSKVQKRLISFFEMCFLTFSTSMYMLFTQVLSACFSTSSVSQDNGSADESRAPTTKANGTRGRSNEPDGES